MAQVVKVLKARQGDLSTQHFASQMDLSYSLLNHIYNDRRDIGIDAAEKMIKYFRAQNDMEATEAIKDYILTRIGFVSNSSP